MKTLLIGLMLASCCVLMCAVPERCLGAEGDPADVFARRIMPIFKSPNPSSCTQCHLSGVDLKQYILPSSEKTFLSLRDQGLVDLAKPEDSTILKLISMRDPEADASADPDVAGKALIHEKTRKLELDAFAAWIVACAADEKLVNAPKLPVAQLAEPKRPVEVIRHARVDHVLESFENSIWAMRFRCMSCHIEGTKENDKLRAEHGDQVAWMKKAGPKATLEYLLAAKLIDLKKPEQSLILRKPLMEVEHKGGKKFIKGDQGYRAYRGFIEDLAKIKADKYATAAALPKDDPDVVRYGTDIWIKITNTPPAWGDAVVRADIYRWDTEKNDWSPKPIATTDRANFAKGRLWQHNLTVLTYVEGGREALPKSAPPASGEAALTPGRYLLKAYVNQPGNGANDWNKPLGKSAFAGEAEFQANWRPGYGAMTAVDGTKLK